MRFFPHRRSRSSAGPLAAAHFTMHNTRGALPSAPTYFFGPIAGPSPTLTKPAGACPVAWQLATAAAAAAFTAAIDAALWSCGTTTAVQAVPTLLLASVPLATIT